MHGAEPHPSIELSNTLLMQSDSSKDHDHGSREL